MPKKEMSEKDIETLTGKMDWKYLEGTIEVTLEVKTQEDFEERLKQIAEQIITQNNDVYKVSHKSKIRIRGLTKSQGRK